MYHVTFHWRETAVQFRAKAIEKAKEIIQKHGFQALDGNLAVDARPAIGWDKGRGSFMLLEKLHGITWASTVRVVFIGDDETDEDALRALSGLGTTFKVGKPKIKTFATHRLPNTGSVKTFLEWALDMKKKEKENNMMNMMTRRNQGMTLRRDFSRTSVV